MPEETTPMSATRSLRVTLPEDMAEMVKAKVESGEYASESEVVGDALRALRDRDDVLTRWLKEEVVAAYDEYRANPSDVVDADEMMERIEESYRARNKET